MDKITSAAQWKKLTGSARKIKTPEYHLRNLINQRDRQTDFSIREKDFFFDYSMQRVTGEIMDQLWALPESRGVLNQFGAMASGLKVNVTEGRAALHTALRKHNPEKPITLDERNILPEIFKVREEIKDFSGKIRSGEITGTHGRPFTDLVVVGIGGSSLGTEFVCQALSAHPEKMMDIHFLSNVDSDNFNHIKSSVMPETTLWIIISKSYTTVETLANTELVYGFLKESKLSPCDHVVTVTAKGSPGDTPENPVIKSFHMFDYIGGRFSVTSAVGGVPLSICFGYDCFDRILLGAEEMDNHAITKEARGNIPLTSALLSIWNNNFLKYRACGIIPYAAFLSKLAPHVQQLYMESCGKSVLQDGRGVECETGVIIFGEPGTNAQHSFFQLAHQGNPFPVEFIGVINPGYGDSEILGSGVTNHQELWANMISQSLSLATGKDNSDGSRYFPGNRPSSTIIINSLSPENIGRLLSYYEAKTVFEAFLWGINPFDQFGVELGKINAAALRQEMKKRNKDAGHKFQEDGFSSTYLEMLFRGSI